MFAPERLQCSQVSWILSISCWGWHHHSWREFLPCPGFWECSREEPHRQKLLWFQEFLSLFAFCCPLGFKKRAGHPLLGYWFSLLSLESFSATESWDLLALWVFYFPSFQCSNEGCISFIPQLWNEELIYLHDLLLELLLSPAKTKPTFSFPCLELHNWYLLLSSSGRINNQFLKGQKRWMLLQD